ncbi:MAG: GNAT family N-acetyltransferase [Candidatus Bathyarchaeota archaeon]|nr:GNAT family N-acetyltransferase [Candidatus Bathyarchaeota archaeon]
MPFSIREATSEDLDDIYKIELECFTDDAFTKRQLEYCLSSPGFVTLICFLDGQPIGFITGLLDFSKGNPAGRIYTVDVKPEHRRKGVGSRLLSAFERVLVDRDVEICYLEVRADNEAAKRLYLKHGYKTLEPLRGYYGLGEDGIRLKKVLRPSGDDLPE